MTYRVNENCIGCGLCTSLCPELFFMNNEGLAEAQETDTDLSSAKEAMDSCPVMAIEEA